MSALDVKGVNIQKLMVQHPAQNVQLVPIPTPLVIQHVPLVPKGGQRVVTEGHWHVQSVQMENHMSDRAAVRLNVPQSLKQMGQTTNVTHALLALSTTQIYNVGPAQVVNTKMLNYHDALNVQMDMSPLLDEIAVLSAGRGKDPFRVFAQTVKQASIN